MHIVATGHMKFGSWVPVIGDDVTEQVNKMPVYLQDALFEQHRAKRCTPEEFAEYQKQATRSKIEGKRSAIASVFKKAKRAYDNAKARADAAEMEYIEASELAESLSSPLEAAKRDLEEFEAQCPSPVPEPVPEPALIPFEKALRLVLSESSVNREAAYKELLGRRLKRSQLKDELGVECPSDMTKREFLRRCVDEKFDRVDADLKQQVAERYDAPDDSLEADDSPQVVISIEARLDAMDKDELADFAETELGVSIDKRKSTANLRRELLKIASE